MVDPLENVKVSSQYGKFRPHLGETVHQGFDLVPSVSGKTQVYATAEGEVVFVGFRAGSYGNMIAIKRTNAGAQTGNFILYKHLRNSFLVKKGDQVKPGQHIGYYSGTKNHSDYKPGRDYDPHLHFEYMVEKDKAQQYEYSKGSQKVMGKFVNLGKKGLGDRTLMALSNSKYYTDPTPYMCNDWPFKYPSETGFGFKSSREQYNSILSKLGQSGFEVGGMPNNVVNGQAPGLGEYSIAMGCMDLEQTVLESQNGGTASAPASASAPQASGGTQQAAGGIQSAGSGQQVAGK